MPNLSTQEIQEFNAIKTDLLNAWYAAIDNDELKKDGTPKLKDEKRRFIPKDHNRKRVDIDEWLEAQFNDTVIKYLKEFQKIAHSITAKILTNGNSDNTKVKKLTVYRKMIAEMLGEDYQKTSYDLIPYALFAFPDDGKLVAVTNKLYTDKVTKENTGINRIPITKKLLHQLIEMAVNDLRKKPEVARDYGSKMIAMELLTGRRQYEEILNSECKFKFFDNSIFEVQGLAKASELKKKKEFLLPFLGVQFQNFEGELSQLLTDNLKLLRNYVDSKEGLKTPRSTLLNRMVLQATLPYDRLLKPVRDCSELKAIDGKTHFFRKVYAFGCYVFLDGCESNESQYFAQVLAEGTLQADGTLNLNLITAKSYSIFKLVSEL